MVFEKVKAILNEQFEVDESKIAPETDLLRDLSMDSLDVADLIVTLEDEFKIEISDEMLASIQTIQDIVEYIETHKGSN